MAGFYKVVLRGVVSGQEINNILYYGSLIPIGEDFDETDATELGEAVNDAWIAQILPQLVSGYAYQGCDVSMVDESGSILSPFVVSVVDSGAGGQIQAPDGPGSCVIAKFNCTPVAEASGHPVPRRSYLAVGPLHTEQIGTSGLLTGLATWQNAFTAAFTQGHLLTSGPVVPYRVGRDHPRSASDPTIVPGGVGRVHSVVARPYASFRRSRMFSPTGN